jgi:hypothetical protein
MIGNSKFKFKLDFHLINNKESIEESVSREFKSELFHAVMMQDENQGE